MAKRTPLYDVHLAAGARMVEFAGFDMPLQYEGIAAEHNAVRTSAGLFDVSHMGKLEVRGMGALEFLNSCVANGLGMMQDGQVVYTPVCYEDGGTLDDILIYRFDRQRFLLVVNAANKDKVLQWLQAHLQDQVHLADVGGGIVQLALQGPSSAAMLESLGGCSLAGLSYYHFMDDVSCMGTRMLLSRTGYTGEDGFELYLPAEEGPHIWKQLMDAGAVPCGLGARDTLRFEAGMPLYGSELSENITPIEAGLTRFIDLNKGPFIGREALAAQVLHPPRRLVGFELLENGISRHGEQVYSDSGDLIGVVTTGYKSPFSGRTLGMALVDGGWTGKKIRVSMRSKLLAATIVDKRFYKKEAHAHGK